MLAESYAASEDGLIAAAIKAYQRENEMIKLDHVITVDGSVKFIWKMS